MNLKSIIQSENILSIYLFAFLIPLNPKWYGFGIIFIALELLIKYKAINKSAIIEKLTWKNPMIYLFAFFLAHWVGLLNTSNFSFAFMDIGMKASFVIFPVLFIIFPVQVSWDKFRKAFILGALASILIAFSIATMKYLENGKIWMFRDKYLAHWMHRSYWSAYLNIALLFLLQEWLNAKRFKLLYLFPIVLFLVTIILLGSKIMLLGMVIVFLAVLLNWIWKTKSYLLGLSVFVAGTAIIASVFYFTPSVANRLKGTIETFSKPKEIDVTSTESNISRILMWETAVELIKENPISGVGTGDIKDALKQRNIEKGYTGVAEANLNAHSQFLNTQLALGILGSLSLLFVLISSLAIKNKIINNYSFEKSLIISLFIISLSVESFLEIQAGIIPFAFFISVFGIQQRE